MAENPRRANPGTRRTEPRGPCRTNRDPALSDPETSPPLRRGPMQSIGQGAHQHHRKSRRPLEPIPPRWLKTTETSLSIGRPGSGPDGAERARAAGFRLPSRTSMCGGPSGGPDEPDTPPRSAGAGRRRASTTSRSPDRSSGLARGPRRDHRIGVGGPFSRRPAGACPQRCGERWYEAVRPAGRGCGGGGRGRPGRAGRHPAGRGSRARGRPRRTRRSSGRRCRWRRRRSCSCFGSRRLRSDDGSELTTPKKRRFALLLFPPAMVLNVWVEESESVRMSWTWSAGLIPSPRSST